jgi:subtilisin family serine protease
MRFKTALTVGALTVGVFALPAATAVGQTASSTYIVQMLEPPAVAYEGGVAGIPATKPGKGNKINPAADNVQSYRGHLKSTHDKALANVGGGGTVYDYGISFNGFAARLTDAQADAMRLQKGVVAVTPDEMVTTTTFSTPAFLGLTARGGLWDQLGGVSKGGLNRGAGEDIVIGVLDSGIWPESLSFSDRKLDGSNGNNYPHQVTGFHGTCQGGEQFSASNCNRKLIGARYFNAAWGGDAALEAARPWEFMSPRDYNGHGTHTASESGGNFGVKPTGDARFLPEISGIAPRARIAAYKGLWSTQDGSTASGFTADLVAAVDAAVADGVDVINYSISGTNSNFLDPVEVAFLFAADAGVFISASAGNTGPGASTVNHPSPWITTVAAGMHDRTSAGSVTIDGVKYDGPAYTLPVTGQLIDGTNAGFTPAPNDAARQCFAKEDNGGTPALDPAKVAGKIVLCDRGVNVLVNKGRAVAEAGGIGMVLTNVAASGPPLPILHRVPAVHVPFTAPNYAALHAAAGAGKIAAIAQSTLVFGVPAPTIASFSSRGPLVAGAGDLLKPDLMAPGVEILASTAPPGTGGRNFDLFQGTSMSAPHVAGLAALLKQKFPSWSPMAVKSALMTSGIDVVGASNTSAATIFAQGAGHVRPNSAAEPGLVFDSNANDWLAFLCGTTTGVSTSTCNALKAAGFSTDPSDMNVPSVAIGDLPGSQTVKRRVTNVGASTSTYSASVAGMAGLNVSVSPSSFSIAPGQTQSLEITITNVTAALNAYVGGQLTLSDGTHRVRIPLVVQPVKFQAPAEVSGSGASGSVTYNVKSGYNGNLSYSISGLQAATKFDNTVNGDAACAFNTANPDANVAAGNATVNTFTTPAGANFIRFQTFQADANAAVQDLDMYVYRAPPGSSTFALVLVSGGPDANEVTNTNSAASLTVGAQFKIYVHGCGVGPGQGAFTLFSWALTGTPSNPFTAVPAPQAVTIGQTIPITFGWSGLPTANRYLGRVLYVDPAAPTVAMAATTIAVSTR